MNPTYEHHRPYDGCDLYRGDALDVLPLLAEEGITADMEYRLRQKMRCMRKSVIFVSIK